MDLTRGLDQTEIVQGPMTFTLSRRQELGVEQTPTLFGSLPPVLITVIKFNLDPMEVMDRDMEEGSPANPTRGRDGGAHL